MENQSSNYEWYTRETYLKNEFKVYIKEGTLNLDDDKRGFWGVVMSGNADGFKPKLRVGEVFATQIKPVEFFIVIGESDGIVRFKPYPSGDEESEEQWNTRLNGGFRLPQEGEFLFFTGTTLYPEMIYSENPQNEKDIKVKEPWFGVRFTTLITSGIFMAIVVILSALAAMGVSESALGYVALPLVIAGLIAMWLVARKVYGPKKPKKQ